MSEESTTPDPVELVRRFHEAWRERDADTALALLVEVFRFQDGRRRQIADFTNGEDGIAAAEGPG